MGDKRPAAQAIMATLAAAIAVSLTAQEPSRPPVAVPAAAPAGRAPTVLRVDLATGASTRFRLSATPVEKAERYDDHDTPAFVVRGDGRLVAVWAGHGYDNRILSRVSLRPGDATAWRDQRPFVPSPSSSVTYANLPRLAGERGRIYDSSAAWTTASSRRWPGRTTRARAGRPAAS